MARSERRLVGMRLPVALIKRMKRLVIENDTSMQAIAETAISLYVDRCLADIKASRSSKSHPSSV